MSKRNKESTYTKILAIIGVAIITCFILDMGGVIDVPFLGVETGDQPSPEPGPEPFPTAKTPCDYGTAIVTTDIAAWDTLDISTARTAGTDINTIWFRYSGGWIKLASGDAQDLSVQKADNNRVYLALEFPSSPGYYVDYEKTMDMNPHLSWYGYEDITGDSVEEFIFKVDISGSTFASATGKWNMPAVNVYLLTYDASFAIPSGGQPADVTAIGTSTVTKYLKWYAEVSAEKKGIALYKVVFTVNTSDISKVKLKKLNVPGVGYLDGSSFEQDVLASSIKYTYTLSPNILYGAGYVERPVNDPNEFEFTAAVELNMATNDTLQATLNIYELSPAEASLSDQDSVILQEAS